MFKVLFWLFIIVLAYGFLTEGLSSGFTTPLQSVQRTGTVRRGMSTTLDPEFQRAYEEASREYDARMSGVPLNLKLPGGDTVRDRINAQTGGE
jgi:hypothetical protein